MGLIFFFVANVLTHFSINRMLFLVTCIIFKIVADYTNIQNVKHIQKHMHAHTLLLNLGGGEIGCHGLVVFAFGGEGMAKRQPSRTEYAVQRRRFAQEPEKDQSESSIHN